MNPRIIAHPGLRRGSKTGEFGLRQAVKLQAYSRHKMNCAHPVENFLLCFYNPLEIGHEDSSEIKTWSPMTHPLQKYRLKTALFCFLGLFGSIFCKAQTAFYNENFEADDGSYISSVDNPGGGSVDTVNPWTYNNDGQGGSLGWSTDGGSVGLNPGSGGIPFEMWLTSPAITVTGTGDVTLQFDHSHNFEFESPTTFWDGGNIMVSVNGGTFNQLDASAFSQNGYNGVMQNDFDWGYPGDFNGQDIFGDSSGGYITSIATLGSFIGGDTVSIRFRGGWDWFVIAGAPNWAIDNVQLSLTAIPEAKTSVALMAWVALMVVFSTRGYHLKNLGTKNRYGGPA